MTLGCKRNERGAYTQRVWVSRQWPSSLMTCLGDRICTASMG